MVVVVEVVVVVLRGARAHEEGEHEGEEENADGGGTRGASGKHGVCRSICKRVLSEEEQTVATLLDTNLEAAEFGHVLPRAFTTRVLTFSAFPRRTIARAGVYSTNDPVLTSSAVMSLSRAWLSARRHRSLHSCCRLTRGDGRLLRRVQRRGGVFQARRTARHRHAHACAANARAYLERAARGRARAPSLGRRGAVFER